MTPTGLLLAFRAWTRTIRTESRVHRMPVDTGSTHSVTSVGSKIAQWQKCDSDSLTPLGSTAVCDFDIATEGRLLSKALRSSGRRYDGEHSNRDVLLDDRPARIGGAK